MQPDMITKGYEYALKYGQPRNADAKRYRVQPKCCRIVYNKGYRCEHEWEPKFELPFGDPHTGRAWVKPNPDTGTYLGGTHFDDDPSWFPNNKTVMTGLEAEKSKQ